MPLGRKFAYVIALAVVGDWIIRAIDKFRTRNVARAHQLYGFIAQLHRARMVRELSSDEVADLVRYHDALMSIYYALPDSELPEAAAMLRLSRRNAPRSPVAASE